MFWRGNYIRTDGNRNRTYIELPAKDFTKSFFSQLKEANKIRGKVQVIFETFQYFQRKLAEFARLYVKLHSNGLSRNVA